MALSKLLLKFYFALFPMFFTVFTPLSLAPDNLLIWYVSWCDHLDKNYFVLFYLANTVKDLNVEFNKCVFHNMGIFSWLWSDGQPWCERCMFTAVYLLCAAQQPACRDRTAQETPSFIRLQKQTDWSSWRAGSLYTTGGTANMLKVLLILQ